MKHSLHACWPNQVEMWLTIFGRDVIRGGIRKYSIPILQTAEFCSCFLNIDRSYSPNELAYASADSKLSISCGLFISITTIHPSP